MLFIHSLKFCLTADVYVGAGIAGLLKNLLVQQWLLGWFWLMFWLIKCLLAYIEQVTLTFLLSGLCFKIAKNSIPWLSRGYMLYLECYLLQKAYLLYN